MPGVWCVQTLDSASRLIPHACHVFESHAKDDYGISCTCRRGESCQHITFVRELIYDQKPLFPSHSHCPTVVSIPGDPTQPLFFSVEDRRRREIVLANQDGSGKKCLAHPREQGCQHIHKVNAWLRHTQGENVNGTATSEGPHVTLGSDDENQSEEDTLDAAPQVSHSHGHDTDQPGVVLDIPDLGSGEYGDYLAINRPKGLSWIPQEDVAPTVSHCQMCGTRYTADVIARTVCFKPSGCEERESQHVARCTACRYFITTCGQWIGFTQELIHCSLLEDFASLSLSTPISFTAYVSHVKRVYLRERQKHEFIHRETMIRAYIVWGRYAHSQPPCHSRLTESYAQKRRLATWKSHWCQTCDVDSPRVLLVDGVTNSIRLDKVLPDTKIRGFPWDFFLSTVDKGLDLNSVRRRVGRKRGQSQSCSKQYGSTKSKSGGLLTFLCPHGYVWGHSHVGYAESTTAVLDLVQNYTRAPPKVLIYDFACGLRKTSNNRPSKYFESTHFLLDVFHSTTHTCGYSYRLEDYLDKYEDAQARVLASSLPEVLNAQLRNLAPSVSYSSQPLSWTLTRTFLHWINAQRACTIRRERERTERLWEVIPGKTEEDATESSDCEASENASVTTAESSGHEDS